LTVTSNFTGVTSFVAYNVPGSTCRFNWAQQNYVPPAPITNRSFSQSGAINLNGSFPTDRGAQGTFSIFFPSFPPCITGVVNWTATTDATPPWVQPPPPPPPPPAPPQRVRCRVPNVIGQRLPAARTRIRARNCRVGRVTRKRSRRVGRVIKQNPRGGAVRTRNFRVNLTLGKR
jgi:hypothetical protein